MINFQYRKRIVIGPEDLRDQLLKEDPEAVRAMEPEPFSTFLRKNNLLPPDFDLPEYDEDNIRQEYDEAN